MRGNIAFYTLLVNVFTVKKSAPLDGSSAEVSGLREYPDQRAPPDGCSAEVSGLRQYPVHRGNIAFLHASSESVYCKE